MQAASFATRWPLAYLFVEGLLFHLSTGSFGQKVCVAAFDNPRHGFLGPEFLARIGRMAARRTSAAPQPTSVQWPLRSRTSRPRLGQSVASKRQEHAKFSLIGLACYCRRPTSADFPCSPKSILTDWSLELQSVSGGHDSPYRSRYRPAPGARRLSGLMERPV